MKSGYPLVFLAGCCWGIMGLFMKTLNTIGSTPALTSFLRAVVAAVFIGVVILIVKGKEGFRISRAGLVLSLASGICGVGLFNLCYNNALMDIGAAGAAVLLYTSPVFTCILSMVVFKESIAPNKYLAIVINICGCFLAVTNGELDLEGFTILGVVLGVCAGFMYALMTVFSKIAANRDVQPLTLTFYSFLFAVATLFVISRPWTYDGSIFTSRFILLASLLGIISTGVAYMLYMTGVSRARSVSKVPVIASVETVVASCVGFIYFQEPFGMIKLVGIVLVFISIVVTNIEPKTEKQ